MNAETTDGVPNAPSGLNRRTIIAGAAWSIPVVAASVAAPAEAASLGCAGTLTFSPTTNVGGVPTFVAVNGVAGTDYSSPLTIASSGNPSAQVTVSLAGTGYQFYGTLVPPNTATSQTVSLVNGSATVRIVGVGTGTNAGTLTARVTGVAGQTCTPATLPLGRRNLTISSAFGSGFYLTTPATNGQGAGFYQYDADPNSSDPKRLRIDGTTAGDQITDVYVEIAISSNWPTTPFSRLAGSSVDWTVPVLTGATAVRNGVTYNIWRTTYTGPAITATGSSTNIPVGFYFRQQQMPAFISGASNFTTRYATVNGTPLRLERAVADIVNQRQNPAPTPQNPR
ncbi:hypothetical protein [Pseudoclavibacter helvolus]|uniref:hypothetical protein n=1 Tax=Pseudoclavibacter helvolus TaxID=255205 RepID=UPI003C737A58